MRKFVVLAFAVCLLLAGCTSAAVTPDILDTPENIVEQKVILPLPDTTMDNLDDAILAVSFEEGDVFVDDEGKLQMIAVVYTYDKYDMVDIATLAVGDSIVTYNGAVEIISLSRDENGTIIVNGGIVADGFELVTDNEGVYFERGFDDVKSWYELGTVMLPVSTEFEGTDTSDPDKGEVVFFAGSFLNDEVTDYNFTPYNTTIRVEGGYVVELNRIFNP